jgi:citrate/tricarballylate utilization protein
MWPPELVEQGRHVMTVCNACRYCEGYCPVFPAMENRRTFAEGDLAYLATLCHNCGECLYACQYAPPHEFGINVPQTFARIRMATYEDSCWPAFMRGAFRNQVWSTAAALAVGLAAMWLAARHSLDAPAGADFYRIVPHDVMVTIFGAAALLAVGALVAARLRFARDTGIEPSAAGSHRLPGPAFTALSDALTLRHLHDAGEDCTDAEESRAGWRRRFHHCTFYGFALCFASTSVAAVYHVVGWRAPYDYTSLPVVLGTAGGLGLLAGPAGLLALRARRDPALGDAGERGLDTALIAMLLLTSASGLALLGLRESRFMPPLLVGHLGSVLALFLLLPYGKFVHAVHRMAALVTFAREGAGRS